MHIFLPWERPKLQLSLGEHSPERVESRIGIRSTRVCWRTDLEHDKKSRCTLCALDDETGVALVNDLLTNKPTFTSWIHYHCPTNALLHTEQLEVCVMSLVLLLVHSEPIRTAEGRRRSPKNGCIVKFSTQTEVRSDKEAFWFMSQWTLITHIS